MTSHCGSYMGVGLTHLLPQALCQGCHSELGGAVEMHISAVNHAMSAHAAARKDELRVVENVNQVSTSIWTTIAS